MMGPGGGPGRLLQGETSKPKSVGATLGRFGPYFGKYKLILLLVAVLVIVTTWFQVLTPDLLGQAVDCYLTPATAKAALGLSGNSAVPAQGAGGLQQGAGAPQSNAATREA